jgi:cysteinyl-tRNA synthetase
MATVYLADKIDIHGGGQDLIFPHHDNEIAQCWGMNGEIFCHYWLHNGMVLVNGQKMSKSLNNFIQLKEVVKNREEGDILKYLMLSTHYHQPLNFSKQKWEDASNNVKKIKKFLTLHKNLWEQQSYESFLENSEIDLLISDLCKDFNTVACIFNIHKTIKAFNNQLNNNAGENVSLLQNYYYQIIFMLNSMAMDYMAKE